MQKKKLKTLKKKPVKTPFTAQIFCYIEPANKTYVKKTAKSEFGSESAYINYLISKDRGVKSPLGLWKPKAS
jgi:hypothetical protein